MSGLRAQQLPRLQFSLVSPRIVFATRSNATVKPSSRQRQYRQIQSFFRGIRTTQLWPSDFLIVVIAEHPMLVRVKAGEKPGTGRPAWIGLTIVPCKARGSRA